MALMVLIALGGLLGWLASILGRTERPAAILQQVLLSIVAILGVGLFMNNWVMMGGLPLIALGAGAGASVLTLIAYHILFNRSGGEGYEVEDFAADAD